MSLFLSISDLSQLINTSLLTSESETLNYADNCFIFYSVFRFIKMLKRIIFLNLDNESNFLIPMSSLFHSLTVEGINDEFGYRESTERNY
jgi:hypothetical protein